MGREEGGAVGRQAYHSPMSLFFYSATAASIAETVTLPLDTAKGARPQSSAAPKYINPVQTIRTIAKEEGPRALFQGLEAGLHRQILFTGLRLGLYDTICASMTGGNKDQSTLSQKVGVALATSAIGITVANPSDVVKVRFQAHSQAAAAAAQPAAAAAAAPGPISRGAAVPMAAAAPETSPGRAGTGASACGRAADGRRGYTAATVGGGGRGSAAIQRSRGAGVAAAALPGGPLARYTAAAAAPPRPYRNAWVAYRVIFQNEGFLGGLYRGYPANLLRNCIISSTELVAYSQAKSLLHSGGVPDGMLLHVLAGGTAGLAATVLGSPMDVVGTRQMAAGLQRGAADAGAAPNTLLSTCNRILQREGLTAFYKGFWPNFARVGSFNVVMWCSYEQIKRVFSPS